MPYFDTHCHLDFATFENDRDAVIKRARQHDVEYIMVPAVQQTHWMNVRQLAESNTAIHAAYGLHPMFLGQHRRRHMKELPDWLENQSCKAIGECGLDFFVKGLDQQRQIDFFVEHLKLASDTGLPLIIHARKSVDIVLKYLRRFPGVRGILHSFSGSRQQAEIAIEKGFLLGFGGPVTYPRARKLRQLVTELPLEALVLESDAPDQADASHYGQRNEPAWIADIAAVWAELRQQDVNDIARITTANACRLFDINPESGGKITSQ